MKVTVKSFATFRDVMDSMTTADLPEGSTVRELIDLLDRRFPGIKKEIITPKGNVADYTNILVNGRNIAFLEGLNTIVSENDTVSLFPPAGGG